MPHALLLITLLFATSVAAAPADKTLARRVRDEDAQLTQLDAEELLALREERRGDRGS